MAYFAGVDVGWVYAKAIILNDQAVVARQMVPSRVSYDNAGREVLMKALAQAPVSQEQLTGVVTTGHRAGDVPMAKEKAADVICTSRGVFYEMPAARTIIDVSGQSQRVIVINERGKIRNFLENPRCATGLQRQETKTYNCEICGAASCRYLHQVASALGVGEEDLADLSQGAQDPIKYDPDACAVVARSEVRDWLAKGASREDIVAGVHTAAAFRIAGMVTRAGMQKEIVLTGGGAKDNGLIRAIEKRLGMEVLVPEYPEYCAARGAALIARDMADAPGLK